MENFIHQGELDCVADLSRKTADDAISAAANFQRQLRGRGLYELAREFNFVFYKTYRAGCLASRKIALQALSP